MRVGAKDRQETVAHLGALDAAAERKARALARDIVGTEDDGPLALFEPPPPPGSAAVRLRDVRLVNGVGFGDVFLGWTLWRALEFDAFFAVRLPRGRETVPWAGSVALRRRHDVR